MSRSVEKYGEFNVFFQDRSGYLTDDDSNLVVDDDGNQVFDEFLAQEDWQWLVEDIQESIKSRYPSYEIEDEWVQYPYRETKVILRNQHSDIVISEYCGLVCLGIKINDDSDNPSLAAFWSTLAFGAMMKQWATLQHVGTFSNGEAVFESIK